MAKLPAMQNQYVEFAKNDGEGNKLADKLDTQGVTTLIESGTVSNAKPIYWHTVRFQRGGAANFPLIYRIQGMMIVITNSPSSITLSEFIDLLKSSGFVGVIINGIYIPSGGTNMQGTGMPALYFSHSDDLSSFFLNFRDSDNEIRSVSLSNEGWTLFEDLGANRIN